MVVVVACVLAACAAQPDGTPSGTGPQAPPVSGQVDPVELIGIWAVADPAGTDQGVIRIAPDGFSWWPECGHIAGTWRANPAGMWVGYVHSWGPGCDPTDTPGWMARAVAFRPGPAGVDLIDVDGETTARLRPGATPPPGPGVAPSEVAPPEVTDEVRDRYAPPADLPSGLAPADSAALVGRWRPADQGAGAFVQLDPDGSWHGSDGCNQQGGRWVAGQDGLLLAVSGFSTLIGCDNVPVGSWLTQAARAGLDGDDLVLVDRAGAQVGRLRATG